MASLSEMVRCVTPMLEIASAAEEVGATELKKCYQCGTCSAVCPLGNLFPFSPRQFIEQSRLGLEGFEETAFACLTCKQCWDRCPQEINIPQIFQSMRNLLVEGGSNPASLNVSFASLRSDGNPWGEPREKKTAWAQKGDVPAFEPGMEFALFACCTTELDPRNQKDGLATCALLSKAGLPYGYLGERGTCCGDMAYTAGATGLFDRLQASNLKTFGQLGRGTLLVTSPHCLQSFRNRYPAVLGLSSMHVVEVLERAVNEGRLKPGPMESKVTYHDPCYLGRYNQIYDAPRNVLKAIPGIELVEMRHHREKSMCCGGGGGGVWMERPKGERLGDVRVLEAVETGADTVVTACPFCVQMLEASVLGLNLEDKLKVKTVSEILWSTVDQGGKS